MKNDSITYEILEDGTISVTTDQISGTNHLNADHLLKNLFGYAGGDVKSRKRTKLEVGHSFESVLRKHTEDEHEHLH